MLTIIITKLLLDGAIKTFILKPALNSTASILPSNSVVQATLLNHNLLISTTDLIKFGAEKLFDKFIGKKLDFQVSKLSRYIYGINPLNEFAELFSKVYNNEQELIIDLSKFEKYLDSIFLKLNFETDTNDSQEVDLLLNSIVDDLDVAIDNSPNDLYDSVEHEQKLIDLILKKNMDELTSNHNKTIIANKLNKRLIKNDKLDDFPRAPTRKISEEEEINQIINKIRRKTKKKSKI